MTTKLVLTDMLKDIKIAQVSKDGTDGQSYYMLENIPQFLMKNKEI